MAEEPRPLMYEVGVEGDLFHMHRKNEGCAAVGCVPVTPQPNEAEDAAMFRWITEHATQWPFTGIMQDLLDLYGGPLRTFRSQQAQEFRRLIALAMQEEPPQ